MPPIIAFTFPKGAGKATQADHVIKHLFGYRKIRYPSIAKQRRPALHAVRPCQSDPCATTTTRVPGKRCVLKPVIGKHNRHKAYTHANMSAIPSATSSLQIVYTAGKA